MAEPEEVIVHEGWAANARLGILGLDLERIVEVVRIGELARAQSTAFDPLTAGGYDAFRYRVRAIREAYCPLGWQVARPFGLELLTSADGSRSLLTRAGTAGVGIRDADPQPKGEIGDGTAAAVENAGPLLFNQKWFQVQGLGKPDRETWMLLVYASRKVVRSELSFGAELASGRVGRWFERIILPELDPNDLTPKRYDLQDSDEIAIDVPVIRKKRA